MGVHKCLRFLKIVSFLSSVQNSERGKKIGNVMVTTSRNVVQTGKAVGKAHPQQKLLSYVSIFCFQCVVC